MAFKTRTIASVAVIAMALGSATAFAADNSMSEHTSSHSAMSSHSDVQLQGLYSAKQLLGATVYAKGSNKSIGDVKDVLLDDNMSVKKFVVETDGTLSIFGGKSYVVDPSSLDVHTVSKGDTTSPKYKVMIDMSRKQLSEQPVYSDSWLSNAQTQASQAWKSTKHSAKSAWSDVKSTTSNIMGDSSNTADNAADKTKNAADNAADKTENAADNAADKTKNAADNAADTVSNKASDAANDASNAMSDNSASNN